MIQDSVWAVSIVLMAVVAAAFAWIAAGADSALANYAPAIAAAYRRRVWLFAALLLILIAANWRSLGELPYVRAAMPPPAAR